MTETKRNMVVECMSPQATLTRTDVLWPFLFPNWGVVLGGWIYMRVASFARSIGTFCFAIHHDVCFFFVKLFWLNNNVIIRGNGISISNEITKYTKWRAQISVAISFQSSFTPKWIPNLSLFFFNWNHSETWASSFFPTVFCNPLWHVLFVDLSDF
jgi:hypothetical protein